MDTKPEKKETILVTLTYEQLKDIYEKSAAIGAKEAVRTC